MASNSKQKELHNQTDLVPWCQCNNPPQHLHIYCNCGRRLRCVCKQCKHTFLVQNWKDHKERCGRIQQRKKIPQSDDVTPIPSYSSTFSPISSNNNPTEFQEINRHSHQTNLTPTPTSTSPPFHFSRDNTSPFSLTPNSSSDPILSTRSPPLEPHPHEKTINVPLHTYSRPFDIAPSTLHHHQQSGFRVPSLPFSDTFHHNQLTGFAVQQTRELSPLTKGTHLPSITPTNYAEPNTFDSSFASNFGLLPQISPQITINALKQSLKTEINSTANKSDSQGVEMFPKYGSFKMHTKIEARMPYRGDITRVLFDQKPAILLKNDVKRENQTSINFLSFLSPIEYQHGEEDARRVEVTIYVESANTEKPIHSTEMYFLYMSDNVLQTLTMRTNCCKLISHFDSQLSRMRVSGPGLSFGNLYNLDQSQSPVTSPQGSSPQQTPHSPAGIDSRDDSMQYSLN